MVRVVAMFRTVFLTILPVLLSCGSGSPEPDTFEIIPVDVVRITPPDVAPGDLGGPGTDIGGPDASEVAPSDTPAGLDGVGPSDGTGGPDGTGPGDAVVGPEGVVGPDLTDVGIPDVVEHPDIQPPDTGMVDAGPCGQCPAATPMCQNGSCVCTGNSCPAGFYCKGGKCGPCLDDLHCGPQCESCASMGMYCQYDGSKCVVCDSNHPCSPGNKCIDGACKSCEGLGLCGPECIQCPPTTPLCVSGVCECSGGSCGVQALCEAGKCVSCTNNDPLHCGPSCLVCQAPDPHCSSGACTLCNLDDACGPTCASCDGAKPFCNPDGSGCVPCLENLDCEPGFKCKSFACIADCKAQGCQNNLSPSGKKCSEAWIVGRLEAKKTFTKSTDTWNQSNDDDLNYFFEHPECWDASYDQFYRIYLMPGDKIAVSATPAPNEGDFDLMLKLYTGTECDEDSAGIFSANDKYLVQCWDDAADGKGESFAYTAGAEGWFTVVVDGRLSGAEDLDYGAYTLTLTLTCTEETCCCG